MNKRFSKALVISLALALVIGATLAFVSSAETKPEIISNNVEYGEQFSLMYAVDAATVAEGPVTLTIYAEAPAEGVKALATYTAKAPETIKIHGVETSAYVFTTAGVAPKDLGDFFYAQATDANGKTSDAVKYSVTEYMLERLYGGATITAAQEKMYKKSLEFGIAAQKLLSPDDEIKISDYSYIRVVGGTANGAEKGMYLNGTTLALSANEKGWQATFADGTTKKINGTTYTVEASALIETYNRPLDLTTSYYTTQKAAGEKTFDYAGMTYWKYCTHNSGATLKFLTNSSSMADGLVNKYGDPTHTYGFVDNNAYIIGKGPASTISANVAQTQFGNLNSADNNCFVFESDITFDIKSGATIASDNVDKNNCVYVSRISIVENPTSVRQELYNEMMPQNAKGEDIYFEIFGEYDFEKTNWKSFGIGDFIFENGTVYKMVIEYYKAEGVMKLYIDGYLVKTMENLVTGFNPTAGIVQLQGQAFGSSIYVDNTYVGTVNKTLAN